MGLTYKQEQIIWNAIHNITSTPISNFINPQIDEEAAEIIKQTTIEILLHRVLSEKNWDDVRRKIRFGQYINDLDNRSYEIPPEAACSKGCYFCCVFCDVIQVTISEAITVAEAIRGMPLGTELHPKACLALNPETKECNAYDCRPAICSGTFSLSLDMCKQLYDNDGYLDREVKVRWGYNQKMFASHRISKMLYHSIFGISKAFTFLNLTKALPMLIENRPLAEVIRKAQVTDYEFGTALPSRKLVSIDELRSSGAI